METWFFSSCHTVPGYTMCWPCHKSLYIIGQWPDRWDFQPHLPIIITFKNKLLWKLNIYFNFQYFLLFPDISHNSNHVTFCSLTFTLLSISAVISSLQIFMNKMFNILAVRFWVCSYMMMLSSWGCIWNAWFGLVPMLFFRWMIIIMLFEQFDPRPAGGQNLPPPLPNFRDNSITVADINTKFGVPYPTSI